MHTALAPVPSRDLFCLHVIAGSTLSAEARKWQAIFAQDLASYNTANNKQESVEIMDPAPDDSDQRCIIVCSVCPRVSGSRRMRVRKDASYRARSFIDGHLSAAKHQLEYNKQKNTHQYISKTESTAAATTASANNVSKDKEMKSEEKIAAKIATALACSKTKSRFSHDGKQGLQCNTCTLVISAKAKNFVFNLSEHLNKTCSTPTTPSRKRKQQLVPLTSEPVVKKGLSTVLLLID